MVIRIFRLTISSQLHLVICGFWGISLFLFLDFQIYKCKIVCSVLFIFSMAENMQWFPLLFLKIDNFYFLSLLGFYPVLLDLFYQYFLKRWGFVSFILFIHFSIILFSTVLISARVFYSFFCFWVYSLHFLEGEFVLLI